MLVFLLVFSVGFEIPNSVASTTKYEGSILCEFSVKYDPITGMEVKRPLNNNDKKGAENDGTAILTIESVVWAPQCVVYVGYNQNTFDLLFHHFESVPFLSVCI